MASFEDSKDQGKWRCGQKCEIYIPLRRRWITGEIVDVFEDDDGEWITVKYGNKVKDLAPNDPNVRSTESMIELNDPNRETATMSREAMVTSAVEEIYAKMSWIKPMMRDIIANTHDLKKESVKSALSWYNIMQAVRHELYPVIAMSLSKALQEMIADSNFVVDDLSKEAVDRVIPVLKTKKVLLNKEIDYIYGVVERANKFKWEENEEMDSATLRLVEICDLDSDRVISDEKKRVENYQVLNEQWPGLTMHLLIDIYCVHKALLFGQFQFTDYTKQEFVANIKSAEERVFRDKVCSPIINIIESALNLSFHPSYIIDDDLFEVIAFHFAASSLVNRLKYEDVNGNEIRIRCIVVPAKIISIYDPEIEHKSSINHIGDFLRKISPSNIQLRRQIESNINNVESMTRALSKLLHIILQDASTADIVIVFNRRNGLNTLTVCQCDGNSDLNALYMNYFVGFELTVDWNPQIDDGSNRVVRCWLNYGVNQRLRFFPEYLTTIIPRLFARSDEMTGREVMERVYGAPYKWGWRVSVDDLVFNRYYHIITEYEHISNNYNRSEMVMDRDKEKGSESECGMRDHFESKLNRNLRSKLIEFTEDQSFDSDAILQDVVADKRENDQSESNIAGLLNQYGISSGFRLLRHSLFRYQCMVCCSENVLSIEQCPFIDDVVTDLQRLRECNLEIDASNIYDFDLESIVTASDHILSVHHFLSEDDDHKENREQIRCHILQRVQCEDGSKCKALTAQRLRRREKERADRVEEEPDAVSAEIDVLSDALFAVHCLIFHGENEMNRSEPLDDEEVIESRFKMAVSSSSTMTTEDKDDGDETKQNEDDERAPGAIDFGRSVLRWLRGGDSPIFETLKDELILNRYSTIDAAIYESLHSMAAAKSKNTDYTIDEMVGLKAYSDTNEFQAALGRAHWDSATKEQRLMFYQWAMTLYRIHLRRAIPIPPATKSGTKPRPLYTGFNILLSLGHELGAYYGPLSTTTSRDVANGFSKGNGQIYKFMSSHFNPLRCTLGIDMQSISCYPAEHEVFLYHSVLPLQSTETQSNDDMALVDHLLYSLKSRTTPIVRKEAFYQKLGIKWSSTWISHILSHKLLYKKTVFESKLVIDRLAVELGIQHFRQIRLDNLVELMCGAMFLDKFFSVDTKVPSDATLYDLESVDDFNIPCALMLQSISDSNGLNVFCKEKKSSFDFTKIQTVIITEYHLKRAPKVINSVIVSGLINENKRIKSESDIIISAEGGIVAEVSETKEISAVQRRRKTRRGINLISDGVITINGALSCTASGNVHLKVSVIDIVAESVINNGNISCDLGIGLVDVICSEFMNSGTIYPEPNIMIHSHEISEMRTTAIWSDSEQMIPLSVYDHRGHSNNVSVHHPNVLLVDNTNSYYRSDDSLNLIGDWIIFKMNTNRIMKPSSISIRNDDRSNFSGNGYGIKLISLWMGRDDGYWTKMAEDIRGIQKRTSPQKFALSLLVSEDELMKNGYDLLMMEVLGNWGLSVNSFYSFKLNGFANVKDDI